jgi:hypothetical protein
LITDGWLQQVPAHYTLIQILKNPPSGGFSDYNASHIAEQVSVQDTTESQYISPAYLPLHLQDVLPPFTVYYYLIFIINI